MIIEEKAMKAPLHTPQLPDLSPTGGRRGSIRQIISPLMVLLLGMALLVISVPSALAQAATTDVKPTDATWLPGQRMRRALRRVVTAAHKQGTMGFGFLDFGSFFGAFLLNTQHAEESFELQQGTMYAFLAGGDDEAKDIDVEIFR